MREVGGPGILVEALTSATYSVNCAIYVFTQTVFTDDDGTIKISWISSLYWRVLGRGSYECVKVIIIPESRAKEAKLEEKPEEATPRGEMSAVTF